MSAMCFPMPGKPPWDRDFRQPAKRGPARQEIWRKRDDAPGREDLLLTISRQAFGLTRGFDLRVQREDGGLDQMRIRDRQFDRRKLFVGSHGFSFRTVFTMRRCHAQSVEKGRWGTGLTADEGGIFIVPNLMGD